MAILCVQSETVSINVSDMCIHVPSPKTSSLPPTPAWDNICSLSWWVLAQLIANCFTVLAPLLLLPTQMSHYPSQITFLCSPLPSATFYHYQYPQCSSTLWSSPLLSGPLPLPAYHILSPSSSILSLLLLPQLLLDSLTFLNDLSNCLFKLSCSTHDSSSHLWPQPSKLLGVWT